MKKIITITSVCLLTLSFGLLNGCNTVKGAGRDVANTGKAIERAVR